MGKNVTSSNCARHRCVGHYIAPQPNQSSDSAQIGGNWDLRSISNDRNQWLKVGQILLRVTRDSAKGSDVQSVGASVTFDFSFQDPCQVDALLLHIMQVTQRTTRNIHMSSHVNEAVMQLA